MAWCDYAEAYKTALPMMDQRWERPAEVGRILLDLGPGEENPVSTNVLWITCDELRASAVNACNESLPYRLPAFDRLAREGALFTQCHVQVPKCIPMRGQFLTGRYPHVDGLRTMSSGDFSEDNFMLLRKSTPSLLSWLKARGYAIGLAGKNHVLHFRDAGDVLDPIPGEGIRSDPPRFSETRPDWTRAYFAGRVADDYDRETFSDTQNVEGMIRFLETNRDRPFFALCDISEPHPAYKEWPEYADDIPLDRVPLPPRQDLTTAPNVIRAWRESHGIEALPDRDRRRILRAYWSQCRFADALVQRILDAIDRLGLTENTLVLLGADHGDFVGHYGCYEKWDTALYDCITRVPLILRLPGRIPAGTRIPAMVEGIDICPTILELLELEIPASVHGQSLCALADGRSSKGKPAVFCQGGVEDAGIRHPGRDYRGKLMECYYGKQETLIEHPEALLRAHMVRTATHKLIYRLGGDHELYDLGADPDELVNRFGDPALEHVRRDLESRLLDFLVRYQSDTPVISEIWA